MEKKLVKAVIKQLGDTTYFDDVSNHGAGGGFPGFTYYDDTVAFFRKNKKEIVELAENMANDLGEDVTNMIKGFNCLKDLELTNSQIGKVLYGRFSDSGNNTIIMNALSWFALEEVARHEIDKEENN